MSYNFEYFYGTEAEHFIFFRIPKVLITDSRFKVMSTDSKLLYGLMLDRMGLSNRNGWVDEHNRVYIIYTMEEIIEDMGCARQKAAKLLDELDNIVGLIERKRQGLGKPNIIYVKNFIYSEEIRFENQNSESMNTINQEVPKSNSRKYDNQTSRSMNVESQEVPKSNGNNTNTNNTDYNNTDFNKTILSYPISEQTEQESDTSDVMGWIRERQTYETLIKENIEYDIMVERYRKEWLDEIVSLMVDVVCSKEETIRINKQEYPQTVVKSRFLKIDSSHIEYIHFALSENASNVRNIRAFLITTIYRAPETTDNWYSAKVKHDMANWG